jgi:hypothetical protein
MILLGGGDDFVATQGATTQTQTKTPIHATRAQHLFTA